MNVSLCEWSGMWTPRGTGCSATHDAVAEEYGFLHRFMFYFMCDADLVMANCFTHQQRDTRPLYARTHSQCTAAACRGNCQMLNVKSELKIEPSKNCVTSKWVCREWAFVLGDDRE